VAGVGNGNYNPNATLTGYQWAAMLLKVLNITVPTTGSDWQINTAKAYYGADKFSNVTISAANITREAATQMAYDAMFYATDSTTGYAITKTTYTDGTHATVDTTIEGNPVVVGYYDTFTAAAAQAAMLDAIDTNPAVTYVAGATSVTVNAGTTLAKTVFNVTKDATTGTVATFGRPGTVYTTSKANAAVYGWNATTYTKFFASVPVVTYTAATPYSTVYSDLGLSATTSVATYAATTEAAGTVSIAKAATTTMLGGNGTVTEIYNIGTSTAPSYKAILIPSTFEAVTVASVAATKTHGAYATYTVGGNTYKAYSTVVAATDISTAKLTGTVANGDYVVYYVVNGTAYISALTTVSGVLTAKTATTKVLTIDGKTYSLAAACVTEPTVSAAAQTFYMDQYGYVLGTKGASTAETNALVLSKAQVATLKDNQVVFTWTATVAYADGTVATLNTFDGTTASAATAETSLVGAMAKVVKGVNGYVLTAATAATNKTNGIPGYTTLATGFTAKNATLATGLYANANTLFVYTNYTSAGKVAGTVTTVTGINNVKTLDSKTDYKIYAQDTDYDSIANVVYIFDNTTATSVDAYVYVKDVNYSTTSAGYVYNVIVAGKDTTLTVTNATLEAKTLYASITDNGTTTVLVKAADNSTNVIKGSTSVKNNGGLLFVDGVYNATACATTVPVYAIDTYDNTCTSSTFADMTTALKGIVYVVTDGAGTALAIYVVYASVV